MTILTITSYIMGGWGIYEMTQGSKTPSMPGSPAAPDPLKAAQDAKAAQDKQRRIMLATGGITNLTGGQAVLLGENINTLNLTGA